MESISFNPIINLESKILILGTMPGIKSLEADQYYAHQRNAFWPIMFKIFDKKLTENYKARKEFILKNHLALWDTLMFCFREGSLDSKIKKEQPNRIYELLNTYPSIHSIIFNGKAAEKFHNRYFTKQSSISYYTLPSTSPANARKTFDEKLSGWAIIKELLKY
ncbi:MAG: DNA-deoxyinosine glycosylase [Bacteroidota bacterium]